MERYGMEQIVHINNQEGFTLCGLQLPEDHNEETCINDLVCVDDGATGCNCVACWRRVVSFNCEQLMGAANKSTDVTQLEDLVELLNELVYKFTYTPPTERALKRDQFPAWYRAALEAKGMVVPPSPLAIIGQAVDVLPPLEALKFVPRGPSGEVVETLNVSTMTRGLIMIGLTNEQCFAYIEKYFRTE